MTDQIMNILFKMNQYEEERVSFITCNNDRVINVYDSVTIGTHFNVVIPRHKIIKTALADKANKVVIAHNHPGEHLDPSPEDLESEKIFANVFSDLHIQHTSYIISGNGYYNITDNEKFASNKSEDSQQAFLQTLKSIRNQTRESKFTFITVDANREPSHISVGNNMHDVTKAFYMDKKSVGVAVCIDQNIATDKEISEFVKQIQEGFLSRRGIRMTVPIALNHTEAHYLTIDHDTVLYNKLHSDQDIFKQAQSDLPKMPDLSRSNGMTM